ncbi:hypothetical protein, partial [Mycolicibacterium bacteremicum]
MHRLTRLTRTVAAVVVMPMVAVGCSYGPSTSDSAGTRNSAERGVTSATDDPGAVSILPGTAALGQPLTAKGATITPRADNLAVLQAGAQTELGIEVSFTGVTTPIDATGANGGFRLHLSGGEQIPTSRPVEATTLPLASRVRSDSTGWVFFELGPGMRPTQLQLTAAPAGFGMEPAAIAIWTMPATLPAASAPAAPPPPPPPPG